MSKYISTYFIVRYLHLFVFSPYFIYVGFMMYQNFNTIPRTPSNNSNKFLSHAYVLMFLGLFAGIYNYKLLFDTSNLIISISFLLGYLVILGAIYKVKILNENISRNMLKKSIFNL